MYVVFMYAYSYILIKHVLKSVQSKLNLQFEISKSSPHWISLHETILEYPQWISIPRITVIEFQVQSSWNVMAHGDVGEGNWRGKWRMQWVASTLHTTSEHGVSSITTADAHTSAASSRLNWRPYRFKWTRPFRRKTKSCFCACAIVLRNMW
jgi:hypothetical protein